MTYQDAVCDLVRLWDLLPLLVGPPWRELEPSLLEALERLVAAETDDDREQRAGQVLRLCLPHEPLRRALEPAVRRDDNRTGRAEPVSWTDTTSEVTATVDRSARPGGDQWLAASLEDHAAGEPLRPGHGYVLAISVAGGGPPAEALAAGPVPPETGPGPDADSATLTVEVYGDAGIETVSPVLTLPRTGSSPDSARFRVTPRTGAERLTLIALVTHGQAFVQMLTVMVSVSAGSAVRSRAVGRPLAESSIPGRPDATLVVTDDGDLWLTGPYQGRARLPFSQQDLQKIANGPRAALQGIALGVLEKGNPAHQASVTIPPEIYQTSLAALVRAGTLMFRTLFFGPHSSDELARLGHVLKDLAAHEGPLWLEVVTESLVLPWHLLAFADDIDPAAADPAHIFGLRHRITYLPMRRSTRCPTPSQSLRAGNGPLRVVLAVNRDIDEHNGIRRDLVESQLDAWRQRAEGSGGALNVIVPPEPGILDVLARNIPPAEVLYFFCHAGPDEDPNRLGPIAVRLEFTGGITVSLDDVTLREPADHEFDTAPLVVLNACASADPGSSVYTSFLPYLLGRGARGVIGTEADVPAVFAAAWAQEFFSRLLDGVPLADAGFELTRDLVARHRNVLGLSYALHCDGRNLVQPAVPRR